MEEQQEKKKKGYWLQMAVVSLLISLFSIYVYDYFFAPKIVAVDIKGYVAEQRALYLSGKIDDATLKNNLERLQRKIDSIPKNKIVITGDVVVTHAEAVTP